MNDVTSPPAAVRSLKGAFQGRHGWYSISYDDYLAMKANHKNLLGKYKHILAYWRTYRKTKRLVTDAQIRSRQQWLTDALGNPTKAYRSRTDLELLVMRVCRIYHTYLAEYSRVRRPVPEESGICKVNFLLSASDLLYMKELLKS